MSPDRACADRLCPDTWRNMLPLSASGVRHLLNGFNAPQNVCSRSVPASVWMYEGWLVLNDTFWLKTLTSDKILRWCVAILRVCLIIKDGSSSGSLVFGRCDNGPTYLTQAVRDSHMVWNESKVKFCLPMAFQFMKELSLNSTFRVEVRLVSQRQHQLRVLYRLK